MITQLDIYQYSVAENYTQKKLVKLNYCNFWCNYLTAKLSFKLIEIQ